jgi:hypothetical protein
VFVNAEQVISALRELAGQTEAKTKTKEQKIAKAAASVPEVKLAATPKAVDPPTDDEEQPENELPGLVPVVVLDDGDTFSNLAGARIAFVKPGADELGDGAYENGIPISGLLELYECIRKVTR